MSLPSESQRLDKIAIDSTNTFDRWSDDLLAKNKWTTKAHRIAMCVRESLREASISQKELAARMDVSPQMVSKILSGGENLTLTTIAKIEVALEKEIISIASEHDVRNTIGMVFNLSMMNSVSETRAISAQPILSANLSYAEAK